METRRRAEFILWRRPGCRRQESPCPGGTRSRWSSAVLRERCIGLLFVSVSIRIDVISASPDFRNRGAATLSLFVTVLLVAILLVIPARKRGNSVPSCSSLPAGSAPCCGGSTDGRPRNRAPNRSRASSPPSAPTRSRRSFSSGGRAPARLRRRRGLRCDPGRHRRDRRRRCECMALPHQDRAVRGARRHYAASVSPRLAA